MSLPSSSVMSEELPPGTAILVEDASAFVLVPTPTEDPNDPLNWSMTRKVINITIVYASTVAVFSAIVTQTVFWPQMTVELGMSFAQLNAGISCNVAGLAVGCIFIMPFALKYGRRPIYILSTAVMAAVSLWSGRIQSVADMLLTNLIYGLASSVNETIAQLTIADMFFVHQRGKANGLYIIFTILGNTIIPTCAGLQAEAHGWRWSYYTMAIVLLLLTIIFVFFFEETSYTPVFMAQGFVNAIGQSTNIHKMTEEETAAVDARECGSDGLHDVERTQQTRGVPLLNTYRQRMRLITPAPALSIVQCFINPWRMALTPHVLFTAIQAANMIAFLTLISSINPIVLSAPPYSFGTAGVGLMLVGPFIGNLLGSIYGGILGDWIIFKLARRNNGTFEPEYRLYVLPIPALFVGGGLILYGASLDRGMHWIYPSIGSAVFTFGLGSILDISFTIIIDTYREATAESFVFITFIRNAVPLGLPFGVVPWLDTMSLTNVGIISGCVCTGLTLLFVPVIVWGKGWRTASAKRYRKVASFASHME